MKKRINQNNSIQTKLSYIVEIPQIKDDGFLCFAESDNQMPFPVKRFYYIFDVNESAKRGFHAHKKTTQMLFCIRGSIRVILDNGLEREEVFLDKPNQGLFLDKMMWHEMADFKKDTVLLVSASDYYVESDYIRNYELFLHSVHIQSRKWFHLPQLITLPPLRRLVPRSI